MYSGGFYPFDTLEEYWAWWSRHVCYNRYDDSGVPLYRELLSLVAQKDYFVLTTNVDHCFQKAGFDKQRLFYTQGDYGLFQCSRPCRQETYDNEAAIRAMVQQQRNMRIPSSLIPTCPHCGAPMCVSLRVDDTFVEDEGWHAAARRYEDYVRRHRHHAIVYLELGVGANTPGIIKYNFWRQVLQNPKAQYICVNKGEAFVPQEIAARSITLNCDIRDLFASIPHTS